MKIWLPISVRLNTAYQNWLKYRYGTIAVLQPIVEGEVADEVELIVYRKVGIYSSA